jgi:hypothetical protein
MMGLVRWSFWEEGKAQNTNATKTRRPKDAMQMSTKLHVTRATRHSCGRRCNGIQESACGASIYDASKGFKLFTNDSE